jgi:transcriptional regulator with XRE-family HTH domain
MSAVIEKAAFSRRLKTALARLQPPGRTGVAWLAREFNQRYGGKAISVHAARKWLLGESIPSHDKLLTLAGWLRVSAEWLLYGEGEMAGVSAVQQNPAHYAVVDMDFFREFNALNREHRDIVREMVAVLARLEGRRR